MSTLRRRLLVFLVLLVGVRFWFALGTNTNFWWTREWHGMLIGLIAAVVIEAAARLLPDTRAYRALAAGVRWLRHPPPRALALLSLLIGVLSGAYLLFTAARQHREFFPRWQDENMHLVQMQMLARGMLWMHPHPMADFFETFHVFVKPVYAAKQFPGTALLYVPQVWLHLPYWLGPLIVASAIAGLLYRVMAALVDGIAGIIAVLIFTTYCDYRMLSIMVISDTVVLLMGLLMLWAYLRWRPRRRWTWALAVGAFAGWAAIARPPDALCMALPVGLAMLLDLRGDLRKKGPRALAVTAACLVLAAAPFLTLQLIFDKGVTGRWLTTPHQEYERTLHPGMVYGGGGSLEPPPPGLPQKRDYFYNYSLPAITDFKEHNQWQLWMGHGEADGRLPDILTVFVPATTLLILLPLGLLAMGANRRWVLFVPLPLMVVAYSFEPLMDSRYAMFSDPGVILAIILGARVIEEAMPRAPRRPAGVFFMVALPAMALLVGSPEFNRMMDDRDDWMTLKYVHDVLPGKVRVPAVVLFRYGPGVGAHEVHEEPVYNTDVAWPDDAPIIRAQDLGARNIELFRYYARIQPERTFYLYDRAHYGDLTRLGTAAELAAGASTRP